MGKNKAKKRPFKAVEDDNGVGDDPRFSKFKTDPKFRPIPKKVRKVKIDKRFQSMFEDKRFQAKTNVDKRGRPSSSAFNAVENYKKYYELSEDESDSESEDSDEEKVERKKPKKVKEKLKDLTVDYARGEGKLYSDDSSSGEDSSDGDEENEDEKSGGNEVQFDKWGELDHDAERDVTEDSVTKRLALCNMDWDRVEAEDIFLAMSSFCPSNGRVVSVKIFPSEFGKERMAEEDRLGPEELRGGKEGDESEVDEEEELLKNQDVKELDKNAMEKIRMYQVRRLKYFYAVVEFDSGSTANKVYEECDGMEYELSATRFDLRFIPDEMEFDEAEMKSQCDAPPESNKYKPKLFANSALQLGNKVELTWDENRPDRTELMKKAFEDDDDNMNGFKDLIASGSESENEGMDEDGEGSEDSEDAIEKYKALLSDIKDKEKKKEEEKGNMTITWGSSGKSTSKKKTKTEEAEDEEKTTWEKYLEKRKDKKKAKREAKQKKNKNDDGDEKSEGEESEDEIPEDVDFNDPFFKDAFDDDEFPEDAKAESKNKKAKDRKKKKLEEKLKAEKEENDNKDLSLLVMDDQEDDKHFDYKEIVKAEGQKGKKKKNRKNNETKAGDEEKEEDFKIDLKDDRFGAIFDEADYNVDPSHPSFKKTKSMTKFIEEKQKRILDGDKTSSKKKKKNKFKESPKNKEELENTSSKSSNDLSSLVNAIKSKTKGKL